MALKWVLANDANDKIDKGQITINQNTTFTGDATIVSKGKDETTIIKGGEITFTRGGLPLTTIKNIKIGTIRTDSKGSGRVTFNNFKNTIVFTSIKSFNVSENIRSMNSYAIQSNVETNEWQFFLYGTETSIGALKKREWGWSYPSFSTTVNLKYASLGAIRYKLHISNRSNIEYRGGWFRHWVDGKINYDLKIIKNDGHTQSVILKNNYTVTFDKKALIATDSGGWNKFWWRVENAVIDETVNINNIEDFSKNTYITVEISNAKIIAIANIDISSNSPGVDLNLQTSDLYTLDVSRLYLDYSEENIIETVGEGDIQYIAMEI